MRARGHLGDLLGGRRIEGAGWLLQQIEDRGDGRLQRQRAAGEPVTLKDDWLRTGLILKDEPELSTRRGPAAEADDVSRGSICGQADVCQGPDDVIHLVPRRGHDVFVLGRRRAPLLPLGGGA
jgi:hypothetical protein